LLAASLVADLARVALGIALVVAAIAKVAAGTRWVDQAAALGVHRLIAAVLPWFELVIGAALVAGLAEPWPAAIAIGLLAIFTAWIAIHLVRGEHPPCACFGSFSAAPLSWWHVARNGALIALGALATIP
jgi:uncharacterized membrane protein YphA (DoxX/SURF4 family)